MNSRVRISTVHDGKVTNLTEAILHLQDEYVIITFSTVTHEKILLNLSEIGSLICKEGDDSLGYSLDIIDCNLRRLSIFFSDKASYWSWRSVLQTQPTVSPSSYLQYPTITASSDRTQKLDKDWKDIFHGSLSSKIPSYIWGCWDRSSQIYGSLLLRCDRSLFNQGVHGQDCFRLLSDLIIKRIKLPKWDFTIMDTGKTKKDVYPNYDAQFLAFTIIPLLKLIS